MITFTSSRGEVSISRVIWLILPRIGDTDGIASAAASISLGTGITDCSMKVTVRNMIIESYRAWPRYPSALDGPVPRLF